MSSEGARTLRDAAAIVGIGQTAFAKHLEPSETELAALAVSAALADAAIAPAEVDGLCSYTLERTDEVTLAKTVGLGDLSFFSQVGYGGGAGCGTVGHAAMAIATGQAEVVVAWRSRKRGARSSRPWAGPPGEGVAAQWSRPFGLLRPVDQIALLTRRYLHDRRADRRSLGEVALAVRAHANANPLALMGERTLSMEEYLDARWISEPLCLYDNCLETDGALAVVLVAAERATDGPHPPVLVHAAAQGLPRQHETMVDYFAEDPLTGPSWSCGAKLWAGAEVGPSEVTVAQFYDAFTPMVLASIEGYGFCGRGEGPDFVADGNLGPGGRLPVNTSGGGLSEAYVHGFNLITEGVRQVRGTSTSQVVGPGPGPGCGTCLVTSGEWVPTSALLLRGT